VFNFLIPLADNIAVVYKRKGETERRAKTGEDSQQVVGRVPNRVRRHGTVREGLGWQGHGGRTVRLLIHELGILLLTVVVHEPGVIILKVAARAPRRLRRTFMSHTKKGGNGQKMGHHGQN
jgi:hypothetical protein